VQKESTTVGNQSFERLFAVRPTWEMDDQLSHIAGAFTLFDEQASTTTLGSSEPEAVRVLQDQSSRLGADWLLVYSLKSQSTSDAWFQILALFSLGLFP